MEENNALKFFNQFKSQVTNDINKLKLGVIVEYDPKQLKAKVQLYHPDIFLIEVPVISMNTSKYIIHSPLIEGDIVLVGFVDTDIENIILAGSDKRNTNRKNSLDDALVLGVIHPFNTDLNLNDNFIISSKDGTQEIEFTPEGININAPNVNINGTIMINGEEFDERVKRLARGVKNETN